MKSIRTQVAELIRDCGKSLARVHEDGVLCDKYKWGIRYKYADEIIFLINNCHDCKKKHKGGKVEASSNQQKA